MSARAGVTLIELLVVIAILSLIMGIGSVALLRAGAPRAPDLDRQLASLRREAIGRDRSITRVLRGPSDTSFVVTAFADGRVLAEPALQIDPLTGARDAGR